MAQVREVARTSLPTPYGHFLARAFEAPSGCLFLALVRGRIGGGESVLVRVHSECLTGDTLGSLRCDCGEQLRLAFAGIAAEGRGVVLYCLGQEGRGIGLVDKLRAYAEQERGADTVEANIRLGLPVDARDHREAGEVLSRIGVRSVRLLSNNPDKVAGLRAAGVQVVEVEPALVAPHVRSAAYLRTKGRVMGHLGLARPPSVGDRLPPPDVAGLLGAGRGPAGRPRVVLKFAQTLDGRIATGTGDSRWISGEEERRVSHALRAASDAVMVGVGTVLRDDPRLTVRMVPGSSPMRVVLDSRLRLPLSANILSPEAPSRLYATAVSSPSRRRELMRRGVAVRVVASGPAGVSLEEALADLHRAGVETLLVEGGSRVITSLLQAGLVDRLVVSVAPTILGEGTSAVGDLGVRAVTEGVRVVDRYTARVGDDLIVAGDLVPRGDAAVLEPGEAGTAAG